MHNPEGALPLTESPEDIQAAQEVFYAATGQFLGPVLGGAYPERFLAGAGSAAPNVEAGDMHLIGQPTDFLGLNLYFGNYVRADAAGRPQKLEIPPDFPKGGFDWMPLTPATLYWVPRFVQDLYAPGAIYITENGVNCMDHPDQDGEVHDVGRIAFYQNYLASAQRATAEGIPLKGYFAWSMMDNFEWSDGYGPRMGLVHIDYATQKRTPKLSAHWYREIMRSSALQ